METNNKSINVKEKLISVKCPNHQCDSQYLILVGKRLCRCPKCGKEVLLG